MTRLLLLNGLPGSGKSTLAERYAAEHPGTAVVDVDAVRAGLDHPDPVSDAAGLQARDVALLLARDRLTHGDDVLVPQFLARPPFLLALEALAGQVGARFVEVVLVAEPQDVARRLTGRAEQAVRPEHRLAAALLARQGGGGSLGLSRQLLDDLVRDRPATRLVHTVDGDPDVGYAALCAVLAG